MNKGLIILLLVIALVLGISGVAYGDTTKYVPPVNPPLTKSEAKLDNNKYLKLEAGIPIDYFVDNPQSKTIPANQRFLNIEMYPGFNNTHLLFYGSAHGNPGESPKNGEHRYSGYNILGENIPNINWPNDVPPKNKYLDDNKWMQYPWEKPEIQRWAERRNQVLEHDDSLEPKPEWRKNIWWGLKLMHGTEFRGDENIPWEQYVHVLQPPTFWGWGWGIAWHDENDGRGILYRTIPLAPQSLFIEWVPNLYVKNFNPGTPIENDQQTGSVVYAAEPFTTYTATITFGVNADNQWIKRPPANIPIFIGAAHQIRDTHYKANMVYQSGPGSIGGLKSAYPWGAPAGYKYQTVTFNANKSEIVATFQWTAQQESKLLTAGINAWPGYGYLYEGDTGLEYSDNVARVPITIKEIPDAYVQSISPGTDRPEPDKQYHGTVTYGLMNTFPGPVECKLGLTHNGYPVPGVDQQLITLNPGEIKTVPFVWHGQQLGQNSTIVAKIWPQKPTLKDINWANNTKSVVIYNGADLSVSNLNPGSASGYYVNTSYNGSVVVKNQMNTTVKDVVVKFYKGQAEISGTKRTISSLGPNASTTVNFTWKAPAAKGQINIVAKVNPDRVISENNYDNNSISVPVYINDSTIQQDGGQLHISASATPSKVRAGEGFNISVSTWTDEYVWYETETRTGTNADGSTYTYTVSVRKTRPCPGPQKVIAYFADGNSVELERANPGRPTTNTWQLPPNPNSPQNLRKKYIPVDTQDGEFITKIVAEGAGDSGEFTAKTSVTVIVEGSIYDDVGSRITQ